MNATEEAKLVTLTRIATALEYIAATLEQINERERQKTL